MREDKAKSKISVQNTFHKAYSSDQSKGKSKSFKNANAMLGQLPFVWHNFCYKLFNRLC